jgi:hypothetical protein
MIMANHKDLYAGLKNRSPSCEDSSTVLPRKPSVNDEATRSDTAPNPPAEGERTA